VTKHLIRRGLWPWILGVVLLALVGWALSVALAPPHSDVKVQEAAPQAG